MSDNDDWQSHAFSTRHMHNRSSRPTSTKHAFSIHKTFATYEVKCPAWRNALRTLDDKASDQPASLDLYRLSDNGEGVVGEIVLSGVLSATVVLAASRRILGELVEGLEAEDEEEEEEEEEEEDEIEGVDEEEGNCDNEDEEEDSDDDEKARTRFSKNSFRAPKFWLQWRGIPTVPGNPSTGEKDVSSTTSSSKEIPGASTSPKPDIEDENTGLGYIVFSTNECRKFKGTLNCSALGWKDVALTGHRVAGRNTSDVRVTWGEGGREM